jgi:hypothetical protein
LPYLRPLPLAFLTAALAGELRLLFIMLAPISHQRIFIQKLFIQKRCHGIASAMRRERSLARSQNAVEKIAVTSLPSRAASQGAVTPHDTAFYMVRNLIRLRTIGKTSVMGVTGVTPASLIPKKIGKPGVTRCH